MPDRARAGLMAFDANTATLIITEYLTDRSINYWHTKDGGATWTSHPLDRPPAETVLASGGRYRMRCPGTIGLEGRALDCERPELVKIGSGPAAAQPSLGTKDTRVYEGGDGRLWLFDDGRKDWIMVSEDDARTWRQLPWPAEGVGVASLALSPDGGQVWVTGHNGLGESWFWELVGSQWVKRDLEVDRLTIPMLLDDGIWLVRRGGATGYLKDGVFTAIPGSITRDGAGGRWLRDGTVILPSADEVYLGTGTGTRREWVRITS